MANFTPQQIEQFLQEFFDVVGTRQYIGARYIPIFGRRGESSIEWDNSAPYEPLTVVIHLGNSYTSRQYVPTGVALTDTDYWVETGNYNAQVEQYRQEVLRLEDDWDAYRDEIDADLSTYQKRQTELYVFGDSWGVETWWPERIAQSLGLTLHNMCEQGAGFLAQGRYGHTFGDILTDTVVPDSEIVRYVIVIGLTNDMGLSPVPSQATEQEAVGAFFTALKAKFPHSQILYVPNYRRLVNGMQNSNLMYLLFTAIETALSSYVGVAEDSIHWFTFGSGSTNWNSDNIHLTATGYALLGGHVMSCLLGQNASFMPSVEVEAINDTVIDQLYTSNTDGNVFINAVCHRTAATPSAIGFMRIGNNTPFPGYDVMVPVIGYSSPRHLLGTATVGSNGTVAIYPESEISANTYFVVQIMYSTTVTRH